MASILIILFLAFLAWFWLSSIRVKEIAMLASAEACRQIEAQFLDQTASLEKVSLSRSTSGRLIMHRTYTFDFSRDRETRQKGHVSMIGQKVMQVFLDDESGTTLL